MCYVFFSPELSISLRNEWMILSIEKLCGMTHDVRLVFARICQLINQICIRSRRWYFCTLHLFQKKIIYGARTKGKNCTATDILTLAQFVIQLQKLQSIRNQSHERVERKTKKCWHCWSLLLRIFWYVLRVLFGIVWKVLLTLSKIYRAPKLKFVARTKK